jgi:hypothetical protein
VVEVILDMVLERAAPTLADVEVQGVEADSVADSIEEGSVLCSVAEGTGAVEDLERGVGGEEG